MLPIRSCPTKSPSSSPVFLSVRPFTLDPRDALAGKESGLGQSFAETRDDPKYAKGSKHKARAENDREIRNPGVSYHQHVLQPLLKAIHNTRGNWSASPTLRLSCGDS